MEVLFWAIVFVVFVLAELATVQLVSIWFAVGALVTLIFTYFFADITILGQLGIFIVSSGIFLLLSIPYLKRRREKGHISTNSELDVGKRAVVIEEINTDSGTGRVTLNGVDWSAVPARSDEIISVESIVTVKEVQGSKLVVELAPKHQQI